MRLLGLNFGHDAAATVVVDGEIQSYVARERISRRKHAGGLDQATIDLALSAAGSDGTDIDWIAVTSTQSSEMLVGLCPDLAIAFDKHPAHDFPSPLMDQIPPPGLAERQHYNIRRALAGEGHPDTGKAIRSVYAESDAYARGEVAAIGWLDDAADQDYWKPESRLQNLAACMKGRIPRESARFGFHYPIAATFKGRAVPGVLVHHHMAHGAAAFYRSGFGQAAVFTYDGHAPGDSPSAGLFFHGDGAKLTPLMPHYLAIGALYDVVAWRLSLGVIGGAGKLMGLAPYGKPRFYDPACVGNWFDRDANGRFLLETWFDRCVGMAEAQGYDMSALGAAARMTEPVNADIAASTQRLFEETAVAATNILHQALSENGLATDALCLSGGCALNCPANSRLAEETPFRRIFVEPSCADDGLAIGAALHLFHNLLGRPVDAAVAARNQSPYLQPPISEDEIAAEITRRGDTIVAQPVDDPARHAAELLGQNQVVAWFEGRSEIGPRALGHRSLLADARDGNNWGRVNAIKRRELWRPFAPAVLREEVPRYFSGGLFDTRYMLSTSQVTVDSLPAITHVDGSARVQSVGPEAGAFHRLLRHFAELTGTPVVLNTSLNGPGEPIVETPRDAIGFLLSTEVDCLMMGGYELRRPSP